MNKDLRKRLEEAANGIYPVLEIYNDQDMEFVDVNGGLREAFQDGGEVGAEYGYKEAIAQFKDWLFDNAPHSVWEEFVDTHAFEGISGNEKEKSNLTEYEIQASCRD